MIDPARIFAEAERLRLYWIATDPRGEPYRWIITSYDDGWRADIVWDHHDGEIHYCGQAGATPEAAVAAAIHQYYHRNPEERPESWPLLPDSPPEEPCPAA